jgi:hypothetical protein
MSKKKITLILSVILIISLVLTGCDERYTTCDCADLTYELYQEYDKIIFSDKGIINKGLAMRKAKMDLKKDNRYKFCREQGVRPLSIVYYPKNKKIFASCESWMNMEKRIDSLWVKIKDKLNDENIEDIEDE